MRQFMCDITLLPWLGPERIEDDDCFATDVEGAGREGEGLQSLQLGEALDVNEVSS